MSKRALISCFILGIFFFPPLAQAGSANSKEGHGYNKHGARESAVANVFLSAEDRAVIREYLHADYIRNCPPGLAKKNNGCLPPGQAKKYAIGGILPPDAVFVPIPGNLRGRLHPLPVGYQYVQVDKDVLLISEASKKVIDAVTLLSAID